MGNSYLLMFMCILIRNIITLVVFLALCSLAFKNARPISLNQAVGVACEPARPAINAVAFMQVGEEGVASVMVSMRKGGEVLLVPMVEAWPLSTSKHVMPVFPSHCSKANYFRKQID